MLKTRVTSCGINMINLHNIYLVPNLFFTTNAVVCDATLNQYSENLSLYGRALDR